MKFDWRRLKNWRWWVCLPYLLAVIVFVISPLVALGCLARGVLWLVDYIDYSDKDIFFGKRIGRWINKK